MQSLVKDIMGTIDITPTQTSVDWRGSQWFTGDLNTNVIKLQVIRNGAPVMLSENTTKAVMQIKSANGNYSNAVELSVLDSANGIVGYTLDQEHEYPGAFTCQVALTIDQTKQRAITVSFGFSLSKDMFTSVTGDQVVKIFSAFWTMYDKVLALYTDITSKIGDIDGTLEEVLDQYLQRYQDKVDSLTDQVKRAAKDLQTWKNLLGSEKDIWTALNNRVTYAEMRKQMTALSSGTPKYYASISAIQAAYPNGAAGMFYGADTGHVYAWDPVGKVWADCGVYQADVTGIEEQVKNNSPYQEHIAKSVVNDIMTFTGKGDTQRWTFSYQYPAGYIKGAWLNILSDTDQDYEVTLISVKSNVILQTVTGSGHGKIVVPINNLLEYSFYVSIICNQFAFIVNASGNSFSTQAFSSTEVGTTVSIDWKDSTQHYDLGIEFLYASLSDKQTELEQKLNQITEPSTEVSQRATKMEVKDMSQVGDNQRWTFSHQYPAGYIKGAWLNILSDTDQDYEVTLIGATSNRVLYDVSGNGHGVIFVPVNSLLREAFYVSIICNQFAFTSHETNGTLFTLQSFESKVGTKIIPEWSSATSTTYNLGIEFLYRSVVDNQVIDEKDLKLAVVPRDFSSNDFDDYRQPGSYWIAKSETDAAGSPLLNAPNSNNWGYFALNVFQFNRPTNDGLTFLLQMATTYSSQIGAGVFTRYLLLNPDGTVNSDNDVVRKWLKLNGNSGGTSTNATNVSLSRMFVAGDSITAGHPYETVTGLHWWEQVERKLGYQVTTGAQNGAGYLYEKGGTSALTIADATDFSQFDVAVFAFGTNDYGNDSELGTLGDLYPTQKTLYGAINYVIRTVHEKNPRITLILSTPINRADKGDEASKFAYGTKNEQGYTLADVVAAIKLQADYYGINYLDNQNSPFNSLSIGNLLVDKLHPTQEGYKVLGSYLAAKIGNLINPYVE